MDFKEWVSPGISTIRRSPSRRIGAPRARKGGERRRLSRSNDSLPTARFCSIFVLMPEIEASACPTPFPIQSFPATALAQAGIRRARSERRVRARRARVSKAEREMRVGTETRRKLLESLNSGAERPHASAREEAQANRNRSASQPAAKSQFASRDGAALWRLGLSDPSEEWRFADPHCPVSRARVAAATSLWRISASPTRNVSMPALARRLQSA